MPKLTLMQGLPGSGKSTLARRKAEVEGNTIRISRDDLRITLFNQTGILDQKAENLITKIQRAQADAGLKAGYNVIIDDMNLRHRYIREWHQFAINTGADVEIVKVDTDLETCIERDSQRDRVVGEDVIRELDRKYGWQQDYDLSRDPFEFDDRKRIYDEVVQRHNNQHIVLVDIDGTMALNNGHRDWYDYDKVINDSPNKPVVDLVRTLLSIGKNVIFLSGRDDCCYDDTMTWLRRYLPRYADHQWKLLMRKTGDDRPDDIVKREIFDNEILPNYYTTLVLDDRPKVIRMWAKSGLPVFDVDPAGPEF